MLPLQERTSCRQSSATRFFLGRQLWIDESRLLYRYCRTPPPNLIGGQQRLGRPTAVHALGQSLGAVDPLAKVALPLRSLGQSPAAAKTPPAHARQSVDGCVFEYPGCQAEDFQKNSIKDL